MVQVLLMVNSYDGNAGERLEEKKTISKDFVLGASSPGPWGEAGR